jgi:prepilin-type N-terminal cleavage/methylation domain-containing protein
MKKMYNFCGTGAVNAGKMRKSACFARFTLIELLVVIAILAGMLLQI